jgi:hypothetical protein
MNECPICQRNDARELLHFVTVPCGDVLCDDCAYEHRDCSGCADALAQDHGDDLYHRDKDEGRI